MIELMVIVAVIGVLMLIALPKFANLIRRSNERASFAKLRSLRAAIVLYYTENESVFPSDLTPFTRPGSKYAMDTLPIYTAEHGSNSNPDYVATPDPTADTGRLAYITSGQDQGAVWIECTHQDLSGKVWSQY